MCDGRNRYVGESWAKGRAGATVLERTDATEGRSAAVDLTSDTAAGLAVAGAWVMSL